MALEIMVRRGEWNMVRVTSTTPQWVGWVHDTAPAWLRAVKRIVREGRAAGITAASTSALWDAQYRYTLQLTSAIGQLCKALDMPVPCFAPWAELAWRFDAGPLPWWGWQLPGWGAWRSEVLRWAQREQHVGAATNVKLELWHRVGLALDGTMVTPLNEAEGARQTSRGEDWNSRLCPTGVFGAPSGVAEQTWWQCIPFSVWWPPAGAASSDVYVSASVPLAWHWQMAAQCADRITELDTIEAIVAECRRWVAGKNLKAVKSLRRATPPVIINVPEQLLRVVADDELLHIQGDDFQRGLTEGMQRVGAALINVPPVGTIIGIILEGLAAILQTFGWAVGEWIDMWGRREPVLEVPRLSGKLTTQEGSEPEQIPETPEDRDRHEMWTPEMQARQDKDEAQDQANQADKEKRQGSPAPRPVVHAPTATVGVEEIGGLVLIAKLLGLF